MNNMKRIYRLSFLYKFSLVAFCLTIVSMRHMWGDPVWFLPTATTTDIDQALAQEAPANINAVNQDGHTGLSFAAMNTFLPLTEKLLANGADPNIPSRDDRDPVKQTKNTPLHWAVLNGEGLNALSIVKRLIESGANIEARNNDGKTALHMLDSIDHSERRTQLIRMLVLNGSDINSVDSVEGNTITHLLAAMNLISYLSNTFLPVFGDLLDLKIKNFPTSARPGLIQEDFAYFTGFWDIKALLQDWRQRPKSTPRYSPLGLTPLMVASIRGAAQVAENLIKEGLPVNEVAKNEYGNTALHYAVMRGQDAVISLLLRKGANIAARNANGETPIHMLMRTPNDKLTLVSQALEPKITPEVLNLQDNQGNTLLLKSVIGNRLEVVSFLLGQLPKIVKNPKIVAFDMNIKNKDGLTPMAIAKKWDRKKMIQLLSPLPNGAKK